MGSRCSIVLYAQSEPIAAAAAKHAFDAISDVESALSDYRSSSESMKATMSEPNMWIPISPHFARVLEQSKEMYLISDGAFDPTVGAYTHLWRDAKSEGRIPSSFEIVQARKLVGFDKVELDIQSGRVRFALSNMILDFGAIGKGYAADVALKSLQSHGIRSAIIDVGGDLVIGDPPPEHSDGWRVSVQTGYEEGWETRLHSVAIATSGDYERQYLSDDIRYSHIVDPRSGIGMTNQISVTVIADKGATADAVASVITILGIEILPTLKVRFPEVQVVSTFEN